MANSFDKFIGGINSVSSAIGGVSDSLNGLTSVKEQGFAAPSVPSTDISLPFDKVSYGATATQPSRRHLINWFVPDMGVVRMYVNPESISYSNKKLIRPQRTKGGFNIQYWGEELTTITLAGNTGSSGIEGINALYEVYRSEQYTFDSVGLTLSANNAADNVASNLLNADIGAIKNQGIGGAVAAGILGSVLSPVSSVLSPRNLPSLASNALTVEMYYMGWVYRGFFTSMSITEASDLLFTYNIQFTATQRRGYRTNYLPWHKTPRGGGGNLGNHFDGGTNDGPDKYEYYSFSDYKAR